MTTLRGTVILVACGFVTACSGTDDPTSPAENTRPVARIEAAIATVASDDDTRTRLSLDGRASSDSDGDPLTFSWQVPGGLFVEGTSSATSAVVLTFPSSQTSVDVELTVTDERGGSGSAAESVSLRVEREDPSFAMHIQEIFDRIGCTNGPCHGTQKSAGLDLRSGSAYTNLVDVQATSEDRLRVSPGDSRNSYLVIKLEGRMEVGARMPVTGGFLAAVDLNNIKNWIDRGARNN